MIVSNFLGLILVQDFSSKKYEKTNIFYTLILSFHFFQGIAFAENFSTTHQAKIAVINVQAIERESVVFSDLRKQVNDRREMLQKNIQQAENEIRESAESLESKKNIISQEEFSQQQQLLQQKIQNIQRQLQIGKRQLDLAYNEALQMIQKVMRKAVLEVSKKYDLDIILNATPTNPSVAFFSPRVNLSKEILDILNSELPSITIRDFSQDDGHVQSFSPNVGQ